MSIRAIDWVLSAEIKPISDKFVLVVLANYANSFGIAYPSTTRLKTVTGYDRKTIFAALGRLKDKGLIEDTKKRVGETKQIIVYLLPWAIEDEETIPKTELFNRPNLNGNRPNSHPKQSQFTLENRQEPSVLTKEEKEIRAAEDRYGGAAWT